MMQSGRLRPSTALAGVLDQVLSSGTNFLISLVAARLLAPDRFGSVVLALSVAFVAIAVQRALVGDTLLAYVASSPAERHKTLAHDAMCAATWLGVAAGFTGLAIGWLPFQATCDVGWMAVWLPVVLVQDAFRYLFFCEGEPRRALISDLTWAVAQGIALVIVVVAGWESGPVVLAAWGLGAALGALAAGLLARINPVRGRPLHWVRETRHLSGWFGAQTAVAQVQAQAVVFLVAGLIGTAAVGGLRAIQLVLVLPLQSLLLAAQSLLVPRMAAMVSQGEFEDLARWVSRLATRFSLTSGIVAVPAYVWRDPIIETIFGPSFRPYDDLMLPTGVGAVLIALVTPYIAACRGLQNAKGVFAVQAICAAVTVPAVCLGAIWWDVQGATWGQVVGLVVLLFATTSVYRRTIHRARRFQEENGTSVR